MVAHTTGLLWLLIQWGCPYKSLPRSPRPCSLRGWSQSCSCPMGANIERPHTWDSGSSDRRYPLIPATGPLNARWEMTPHRGLGRIWAERQRPPRAGTSGGSPTSLSSYRQPAYRKAGGSPRNSTMKTTQVLILCGSDELM